MNITKCSSTHESAPHGRIRPRPFMRKGIGKKILVPIPGVKLRPKVTEKFLGVHKSVKNS